MFLDIYRQKLDELSGGQFNEQMANVMIGVLIAAMAEFAVQVGEQRYDTAVYYLWKTW